PNSISRMVERFEQLIELDAEKPLYEIFKQYFGYINKGRKGKTAQDDIFAYNGGLFQPDELLDSLIIDDKILKPHVLTMTAYDFQSDVDVNILGHIFENSLNDIENVTAQLEGQEVDKSKTKRKKDGVFYTPKYITKYIVENTVGKLCDEKKAEFKIKDEEYAKGRKNRKKTTVQTLYDNLQAYRNWLLKITICDPACGSGAFLNQALDFLINEHNYIAELEALLSRKEYGAYTQKAFGEGIENHVLENNIYGVDINDESVEIAKLSLWLRTAQRGRKLTSLNNNIKCGNSLIDDPEIAGEKAFNWQKEFPQVFEKGGFDVIIGNPPYVRVQNLDYKTIDFYKNNFTVSHQRIDLYLLFFEKAHSVLNINGILSFINPTMFINSDYGIGLRKFLKNTGLYEIIDFGDLAIFEDAITYTGIFTLTKKKKNNYKYVKIHDISSIINILNSNVRDILDVNDLSDNGWSFSTKNELKLIKQLNTDYRISDIAIINSGCFTGYDEAFFVTDDEIKSNNLELELIYPVIMGKEPKRYHLHSPIKKSIYPYKNVDDKTELIPENELEQKYPNIYSFLSKNRLKLLSRKDSRKTFEEMGRPWYSYTRKGLINVFEKNKILVGYIVNSNTYCLDTNKYMFSVGRVFGIVPLNESITKGLLALLNSKVSHYLMQLKCPIKKGGYFKISSKYLADFRIPKNDKLMQLDNVAQKQINQNTALNSLLLNYAHLLEQKFIIICNSKLENWNELEFAEFLKELEKARKKSAKENKYEFQKLSLSEEAEWMQYFNEQKQKAQDLKEQINQTDKEIDKMVYELYELTAEEIEIVENSVK
ncbi:MAG: DNA methyltransferase, partial [Bacteroidota bacterium]|nr:DNA methyltransferase [Bacteroidota bacterium]